ncbi:MAG: TolC family protein ['Candidatus Kapabacteria' thiocyanatum]|uniref:RND transporter n=1 Tax=Candidatus Kapaibacterium thiocyanatum TaxID=1895771 RepID=A0A1M3L3L9_9BACT|nr:TolC family protein ['Candidatus Kapabacteria' thiocyanatum]OJX59958.1 MAG: RND transporter ['Candidatus Kapabacteria' thiocyanatum]
MRGFLAVLSISIIVTSCVPTIVRKEVNTTMPERFDATRDTVSTGMMEWRTFYADSNLIAIIDTAMKNNQELNAVMQDILIAQNEANAKAGEYLPFVNVGAGAGLEKAGRYTRNGVVEEQLEATPGQRFPEPLPDFTIGARISWEVDIWRKLRNASDAATLRYLSTVEGTRFLVVNIVAELAGSYYELMALDNLLEALDATIDIQRKALAIVQQQKEAAKATELAVRRFDAEVSKNESRRYDILQRIVEVENRINLLLGRYPQHVQRPSERFLTMMPDSIKAGIPSLLLQNRPDVKQAELELKASDLDIDVARARFYPSFSIFAGLGFQTFDPKYIVTTPASLIYNLAGELVMPVINRAAIKAAYASAGAHQVQAAYNYERTVLNAYIEVANQLSKLENLRQSYERRNRQVEALTASVDIANSLFLSARADYMEVLLTQRDALEARMELIETKVQQMRAYVDVYRALGGGWR